MLAVHLQRRGDGQPLAPKSKSGGPILASGGLVVMVGVPGNLLVSPALPISQTIYCQSSVGACPVANNNHIYNVESNLLKAQRAGGRVHNRGAALCAVSPSLARSGTPRPSLLGLPSSARSPFPVPIVPHVAHPTFTFGAGKAAEAPGRRGEAVGPGL